MWRFIIFSRYYFKILHYYYSFQNFLQVLEFNSSFPSFFCRTFLIFQVKQNPIAIVKMWCIFFVIFSITHFHFNQKIFTQVLDLCINNTFLSVIPFKCVTKFLVFKCFIGRRRNWSVVGGRWSIGYWFYGSS